MLTEEKKNEILKEAYYNPETGLGSVSNLYYLVKSLGILRKEVDEFVKKQKTSQLHKPSTKRVKYYPIMGPKGSYQTDLTFYDQYSKSNGGYHVILTCINIGSRKAFARGLKNKKEDTVIEAFEDIISEAGDMQYLGFDQGSEFKTKFKKMLDDYGIEYYVSDTGDHRKMAMVESFNRSIRLKIEKYMTSRNTNKWVDVLPKLMKNYNNSIHSSTGFAPNKVGDKEFNVIQRKNLQRALEAKKTNDIFNVGDKVRLKKQKETFSKIGETYYRGIYTIVQENPFSYKVENEAGEELKRTIKSYDMVKISTSDEYDEEDVEFDRNVEKKEHKVARVLKTDGIDQSNIIVGKRNRT